MMDRIKGWFWKNNFSDDMKPSCEQSPLDQHDTLNKTNSSKNNDTNVNNSSNSSSEPVIEEGVNNTNTIFVKLIDSVTTKAENIYDKTISWIGENTQLTPEDNLPRKLLSSTCAIILYIQSVKLSMRQYKLYKNKQAAVLVSQLCCIGMLTIYLEREWRVALSEPPGENPRTFITAMKHEDKILIAKLQDKSATIKKKIKGTDE